jgi:hypothetical protein
VRYLTDGKSENRPNDVSRRALWVNPARSILYSCHGRLSREQPTAKLLPDKLRDRNGEPSAGVAVACAEGSNAVVPDRLSRMRRRKP